MERINGSVALISYWRYMPSLSTLSAIAVLTPALAGCLLLLSWLQHRRVTALALWGSGFITASVAATLIIVLRGTIPNFWSVVVGNALLAAVYGILWSGARKFDGKDVSVPLALMGVLLWIGACSIGPIYARPEARASVMATIAMAYTDRRAGARRSRARRCVGHRAATPAASAHPRRLKKLEAVAGRVLNRDAN